MTAYCYKYCYSRRCTWQILSAWIEHWATRKNPGGQTVHFSQRGRSALKSQYSSARQDPQLSRGLSTSVTLASMFILCIAKASWEKVLTWDWRPSKWLSMIPCGPCTENCLTVSRRRLYCVLTSSIFSNIIRCWSSISLWWACRTFCCSLSVFWSCLTSACCPCNWATSLSWPFAKCKCSTNASSEWTSFVPDHNLRKQFFVEMTLSICHIKLITCML